MAAPVAAQSDAPLSFRIFGLATSEQFAAKNTFNALFDEERGTFWGGGVELAHSSGLFVDLEISTFKKTGQRAFVSNGQAFGLNIPLTATITPIDVMGGYRIQLGRLPIAPYAAFGATFYKYSETSDFSDPSEDVDTRKTGLIIVAGAEFRLLKLVSASVDVSDAKVNGIIGSAGVSQQFGEGNLGGVGVRFRLILGR